MPPPIARSTGIVGLFKRAARTVLQAMARLRLFQDLHRYGLCRLFVHQFRLLARAKRAGFPRPAIGRVDRRKRWRPFRTPPPNPIGLAAAKHGQQDQPEPFRSPPGISRRAHFSITL
jgi:hypothetical protein